MAPATARIAATQRVHEIEQFRLDFAQAPRRGEHDRKEADRESHHGIRSDAVFEPHDDERSERHFWDHVQADQQRHDRHLQPAEPGEQQRRANAEDDGEKIAAENLGGRHRDVFHPAIVRDEQCVNRVVGRGHDVFRHLAELDEQIPCDHQPEVAQDRPRIALQRLWICSQRLLPQVRRRRWRDGTASIVLEPVDEPDKVEVSRSPCRRQRAGGSSVPAPACGGGTGRGHEAKSM